MITLELIKEFIEVSVESNLEDPYTREVVNRFTLQLIPLTYEEFTYNMIKGNLDGTEEILLLDMDTSTIRVLTLRYLLTFNTDERYVRIEEVYKLRTTEIVLEDYYKGKGVLLLLGFATAVRSKIEKENTQWI